MAEQEPGKEKAPSKKEITSLGQRAVALLGERGRTEIHSIFDDLRYGGLETHVAFFAPTENVLVRVGTMQDWEGKEPRPDAHVVVIEPEEGQEGLGDSEDFMAKETTYDFRSGTFGYTVDVSEMVVVYDQEGMPVTGVHTAGWIALRNLGFQRLPRSERRVMRDILTADLDRQRYLELSGLISELGPHNRINFEAGGEQDER